MAIATQTTSTDLSRAIRECATSGASGTARGALFQWFECARRRRRNATHQCAEDDLYATATSTGLIAESVPDAQIMILPSGGHVFVGQNDGIIAAITEFVSGVVAR